MTNVESRTMVAARKTCTMRGTRWRLVNETTSPARQLVSRDKTQRTLSTLVLGFVLVIAICTLILALLFQRTYFLRVWIEQY